MKIKLIKLIPQEAIIEVELPYYYKHDLMHDYGESIIYGKIEEKLHTSIHEDEGYNGRKTYEIEEKEHYSIATSGLATYFEDEHQSSREEFEAAKQRCLLFLNGC